MKPAPKVIFFPQAPITQARVPPSRWLSPQEKKCWRAIVRRAPPGRLTEAHVPFIELAALSWAEAVKKNASARKRADCRRDLLELGLTIDPFAHGILDSQ